MFLLGPEVSDLSATRSDLNIDSSMWLFEFEFLIISSCELRPFHTHILWD